jgi:hypothetical protein
VLLPVAWRYVVSRRSSTILGREVWLGLELEQLPGEQSWIGLDPDFPPETAPVLLHWDFGEKEMRSAQVMAREVAALCRSRAGPDRDRPAPAGGRSGLAGRIARCQAPHRRRAHGRQRARRRGGCRLPRVRHG